MRYPFPAAEAVDLDELGLALFRVLFGDRTGATVFLAGMTFFALYWRVGVFSSDTYAVANTLVAVADGHLHLERIVYGPSSIATPGLHEVGGKVYGRNYGHVLLALPVLLMGQVFSLVADPRLVVLGTWLLALAGVAIYYGDARWRRGGWFGAIAATLVFVTGAIAATPLSRRWLPLVALQLVTMIAASLVAVFVYRLLAREGPSRVAVVGGLAVVLATPVGFWATIPKRHSITTLLALLSLYALYRSREAPTVDGETWFRALAYAPVGVTAWIHPAEALALLAAVGVVDIPTARSPGRCSPFSSPTGSSAGIRCGRRASFPPPATGRSRTSPTGRSRDPTAWQSTASTTPPRAAIRRQIRPAKRLEMVLRRHRAVGKILP